jgi:anti-sigma B factor antagonist
MASPSDTTSPEIEESYFGDVLMFVLSGEFDAYSGPQVEERLLAAIDQGHYEVIVDMSGVTFIDVSTLSGLVRAIKRVYQHNGHLLVVSLSRPVLRAIELAGMRHSIRVFATREDALEALRPAPA